MRHQLLLHVPLRLPRAGVQRRLRAYRDCYPGLLPGEVKLLHYADRRGRAPVRGYPLRGQRRPDAHSGEGPCLPMRTALQADAERVHLLPSHRRGRSGEHVQGHDDRFRKSLHHPGTRGWEQLC